MAPRTDFLFAKPSFVEGASRIFDFGITLNEYNGSVSEEMADHIALYMDWAMVGDSLRKAMSTFDLNNRNGKA